MVMAYILPFILPFIRLSFLSSRRNFFSKAILHSIPSFLPSFLSSILSFSFLLAFSPEFDQPPCSKKNSFPLRSGASGESFHFLLCFFVFFYVSVSTLLGEACSRETSNCAHNFMLGEVKKFPRRKSSHISATLDQRSWSHLLDSISQFPQVSLWWGDRSKEMRRDSLGILLETGHRIQVSEQVCIRSSKEWKKRGTTSHWWPDAAYTVHSEQQR